jgi:hypothetical protein
MRLLRTRRYRIRRGGRVPFFIALRAGRGQIILDDPPRIALSSRMMFTYSSTRPSQMKLVGPAINLLGPCSIDRAELLPVPLGGECCAGHH